MKNSIIDKELFYQRCINWFNISHLWKFQIQIRQDKQIFVIQILDFQVFNQQKVLQDVTDFQK